MWSEDFGGSPGTPPDPAVWGAEVGAGGWGDEQLQRYTVPPENAFITPEGQLAIEARPGVASGDGIAAEVTSSRLVTKGRVSVLYGLVEARIRVPAGAGLWPAFWMLGDDIDDVGWPACGEIDVMEFVGSEPRRVHGTVHGPGYSGLERGPGGGVGHAFDTGQDLGDEFHVYGVDWKPDSVTWMFDGRPYARLTPEDVPGPWPFRHPFYLLLNLAVGGRWPGNDLAPESLPASLLVDWVRVRGGRVTRGQCSGRR